MTDERNFGVTEARLGLTLLTGLLIALGFAILQRLGDSGASTPTAIPRVERQNDIAIMPIAAPPIDEDQPRVLPIHSDDTSAPRVARQDSQSAPSGERYANEVQPPVGTDLRYDPAPDVPR